MKQYFKIHGDNVVECERIASLILAEIAPHKIQKSLMSPSTITIDMTFQYGGSDYDWHLELLPGFNKAGRARWRGDIFEPPSPEKPIDEKIELEKVGQEINLVTHIIDSLKLNRKVST